MLQSSVDAWLASEAERDGSRVSRQSGRQHPERPDRLSVDVTRRARSGVARVPSVRHAGRGWCATQRPSARDGHLRRQVGIIREYYEPPYRTLPPGRRPDLNISEQGNNLPHRREFWSDGGKRSDVIIGGICRET